MCRSIMRICDDPATRERAMKSCVLMASVSPRTSRAYRDHRNRQTTISTFSMRGPRVAASTSATSTSEIDRDISTSRITTVSTQPPKYPARMPSTVPITPETTMAISDTTSASRAPCTMRLRISMPFLSVPSRYLACPPGLTTIWIWSPSTGAAPSGLPITVASPIRTCRSASDSLTSFCRLSRLTRSTTVRTDSTSPDQAGGTSRSARSPRLGLWGAISSAKMAGMMRKISSIATGNRGSRRASCNAFLMRPGRGGAAASAAVAGAAGTGAVVVAIV